MAGVLHLRASWGLYGAEGAILGLAERCQAQGIPSTVACLVDRRWPVSALAEAAESIGLSTVIVTGSGPFDPSPILQLRRLLRARPVDLLHLHGYKAQVLGLLATAGSGLPLVVTHHGDTAETPAVRLYEGLARRLLGGAAALVVVAARDRERLQPWAGARPIHHIPNGLDAERVARQLAAAAPATLPPPLAARPLVLAVGRLSPEKGHDLLLDPLGGLPAPRPALAILGEGPLADFLRAQAARRDVPLLLPGYQRDLAPWWKRASLFCQPSRREGLPLAVLEAMAAGLPVVASAVGELAPLLGARPATPTRPAEPEAGLLCPPDDVAALRDLLQRLLSDGGEGARRQLGEEAARRCRREHDLTRLADRLVREVYLPLAPSLRAGHDPPRSDRDEPCSRPYPPGEAP
ncbi:MAG: glycosyltransferase family 4 protein [Myxococcota bacterium]|jgi:glycosyltransferase involved in cell wall biosynthesis|nr:glycosyltransferase family 4 protein [Myxococcota bacterium]